MLALGRSVAVASAVVAIVAVLIVRVFAFRGITVVAPKEPLPPRTLFPKLAGISLITQSFFFLGIATFRHVLPQRGRADMITMAGVVLKEVNFTLSRSGRGS